MKIRYIALLSVILLSGCGTPYVPSKSVLQQQQNMSRDQALKIFASRLSWGKHENMCGSQHGLMYDQKSNPKITNDAINLTLYRKGEFIKKLDNQIELYKKDYYNRSIPLKEINRIDVYTKETYPISLDDCFDVNDYRGTRKDSKDTALVIWTGALERFTVRIPEKDADRYIAAVRVLFPNVKYLLAKG